MSLFYHGHRKENLCFLNRMVTFLSLVLVLHNPVMKVEQFVTSFIVEYLSWKSYKVSIKYGIIPLEKTSHLLLMTYCMFPV